MTYELRRSAKDESMLTGEEEDVRRALKEYTDNPDVADFRDFVPTKVLYQVYRDYVGRFVRYPDDPDTLTIRQFGAALRRVFPEIDEYDPEIRRNPNRVMRCYEGKKVWGYCGIKGPLSIRSHAGPGRPKPPE